MKAILANKFLGAVIAPLLFVSLYGTAVSQVVVPIGKTEEQASQLVFWYDTFDDSFVAVTNASNDTPVWVHVQIFATSLNEGTSPVSLILCQETDFNDFYTPNDMHLYDMEEVIRNDPLDSGSIIGDFGGTKGFVVITPIDNPATRNAIAHQHMFGKSIVIDYGLNAMGRDAVSFSTGNVVPDGTVLDGVSNGYVLIQPEILKFNFVAFNFADIVSIAFRDNYEGVFGYVAEPGDAVWTPLIFDDEENPISCSAIVQNCFFDIGVNDAIPAFNTLFPDVGFTSVCPQNNFAIGWMKIAVSGLEGLENELGIVGLASMGPFTASWMHVEGAATPVAPPTEGACDDGIDGDGDGDIDCDDSECAADPACVEGDCSDGVDGDDDGDTDCEDSDCAASSDCAEGGAGACDDGVDNDEDGDTDCADADCVDDPACEEDDVILGGGGGCTVASTASAGSAAADALVLLIPLLGIGLRSMLRRKEED